MTFRDIHELLVSSVKLLLLRDFIKFVTENKDSHVDEDMESNAVAKFLKHENFQERHSKSKIIRFLRFSLVFPSLIAFF